MSPAVRSALRGLRAAPAMAIASILTVAVLARPGQLGWGIALVGALGVAVLAVRQTRRLTTAVAGVHEVAARVEAGDLTPGVVGQVTTDPYGLGEAVAATVTTLTARVADLEREVASLSEQNALLEFNAAIEADRATTQDEATPRALGGSKRARRR